MDYKIVLDAGHGGDDPGASGNGIIEKDLTLKITEFLYDRFKQLGIPVKVTRLTDETLTPTERVKRILDAYGSGSNVIVISNHINAGGGDGAEVIYPLRSTNVLPNAILKEIQARGQNIRDAYQRRLPSDTSKDYYFIQRDTGNTQALTVEYGFLDGSGDDVEQLKNNYKEYAEAVVKAVVDYIKGDYVPIGENIYVVQKGDSLWSIANKYNISVNELKAANNLTSNLLNIGQILNIPQQTILEYKTYTVEKGDSLYSIARKYNISVNELKQANNLTNELLSIGQVLIIPSLEIDEDIIPNYIEYTVQKGDTLYGISNKYNITVDKLKSYNNLISNALSIGQKLKIPKSSTITYIVKKGDSLYSIANKYNTTVEKIKKDNNITTNLLSIGQNLII